MTQQKLTGAALLAEVEQNPKMAADDLAVRCGYTKTTRSRSGEVRIKPEREAYYEALLLARGDFFGIVAPDQKISSRGDTISYKILKTGAGVVPRRFMRMLDCHPDDYFFIKEGSEDGTLLLLKDVEKSEQARIEAASNLASAVGTSEDEEDDDEDEEEIEEGGEEEGEEEVAVQQPAIPGGVSSTTVRIAQPVPQ